MKKKKKLEFPHVLILLLAVILFCCFLTYVVPAGVYEYEEVDGITRVINGSYHRVESSPVGIMGFLSSVPIGMVSTAEIIFFIFIIAGSFNVIQETGAVEAGLCKLARTTGKMKKLIIPLAMIALAFCGSCFGMCEETIVFIPIMIQLAMAMGYDSLTGTGIVLLGVVSGFSAAFMNPFNVGIAQGISGLPAFSGIELRVAMFSVTVLFTVFFVLRYATKVKRHPEISIVYELDKERTDGIDVNEERPFTLRHKFVLIIAALAIITIVFGVIKLKWSLTEIASIFFAMGIIGGLVGGMALNHYAESLLKGMGSVVEGAMVVGVARGILVVLEAGNIIDTILYAASNTLASLSSMATAEGMLIFQSILSFVIPSGSGQAAVTIPIMSQLADLTGVTRQTMVLGFQMADGISEIITPTAGWFMAALSMAKIPYTKWIKWAMPCLLVWYIIAIIFVAYAQIVGYGPF